MSFEQQYSCSKELGRGAFSQVKLAVHRSTGRAVAVKVITKAKMTISDEKSLQREIAILDRIKGLNENVVDLLDLTEDVNHHYLVLELMSGGELFARIVKREKFSEDDAKKCITALASGLDFLHSQSIAHRDLKPENILCADDTDNAQIKFADFGFAGYTNLGGLRTACGSPAYVAPEVISGKIYDHQCDMWSLGVLLYILMCGYPPFYSADRKVMFKSIREADYRFDSPFWDNVSSGAKDLVRQLLVVDPAQRLRADQVLRNEWIVSEPSAMSLVSDISLLDLPNGKFLKMFNARRKWKTGFQKIIRTGKLPEFVSYVKRLAVTNSMAQGSI